MFRRSIGLVVLIIFLTQAALPAELSRTVSKDKTNNESLEAAVCVVDKYMGNEKLVILIKDDHCNYDAQKKIAEMLQCIQAIPGLKPVLAIEGASGPINMSNVRSLPFDDSKKKVLDGFMKKGLINGMEYISASSNKPISIFGIDDPVLYLSNVKTFRNVISNNGEALDYIDTIQKRCNEHKSNTLNPQLLAFEHEKNSFHDNEISIDRYLNYLSSFDCYESEDYHEIDTMLKAVNADLLIDYDLVDKEKELFLQYLSESISTEDMLVVIENGIKYSQNAITEEAYYNMMDHYFDVLHIDRNSYKNLSSYITSVTSFSLINYEALRGELLRLEKVIQNNLMKSTKEQEYYKIKSNLLILKKLLTLSLCRSDLKQNVADAIENIDFEYKIPHEVLEMINDAVSFYTVAQKRDLSLSSGILNLVEDSNCVIALTGGFHTESLSRKLRSENISHIVYVPRVLEENPDNPYYELLLSDTFARVDTSAVLRNEQPVLFNSSIEGLLSLPSLFSPVWDSVSDVDMNSVLLSEILDNALKNGFSAKEIANHWYRKSLIENHRMPWEQSSYENLSAAYPNVYRYMEELKANSQIAIDGNDIQISHYGAIESQDGAYLELTQYTDAEVMEVLEIESLSRLNELWSLKRDYILQDLRTFSNITQDDTDMDPDTLYMQVMEQIGARDIVFADSIVEGYEKYKLGSNDPSKIVICIDVLNYLREYDKHHNTALAAEYVYHEVFCGGGVNHYKTMISQIKLFEEINYNTISDKEMADYFSVLIKKADGITVSDNALLGGLKKRLRAFINLKAIDSLARKPEPLGNREDAAQTIQFLHKILENHSISRVLGIDELPFSRKEFSLIDQLALFITDGSIVPKDTVFGELTLQPLSKGTKDAFITGPYYIVMQQSDALLDEVKPHDLTYIVPDSTDKTYILKYLYMLYLNGFLSLDIVDEVASKIFTYQEVYELFRNRHSKYITIHKKPSDLPENLVKILPDKKQILSPSSGDVYMLMLDSDTHGVRIEKWPDGDITVETQNKMTFVLNSKRNIVYINKDGYEVKNSTNAFLIVSLINNGEELFVENCSKKETIWILRDSARDKNMNNLSRQIQYQIYQNDFTEDEVIIDYYFKKDKMTGKLIPVSGVSVSLSEKGDNYHIFRLYLKRDGVIEAAEWFMMYPSVFSLYEESIMATDETMRYAAVIKAVWNAELLKKSIHDSETKTNAGAIAQGKALNQEMPHISIQLMSIKDFLVSEKAIDVIWNKYFDVIDEEDGYEVVYVNSIVNGLDDFKLGERRGKKLYLSIELLNRLAEIDEKEQTNLVSEYLYHEIHCRGGKHHYEVIRDQLRLFPENYKESSVSEILLLLQRKAGAIEKDIDEPRAMTMTHSIGGRLQDILRSYINELVLSNSAWTSLFAEDAPLLARETSQRRENESDTDKLLPPEYKSIENDTIRIRTSDAFLSQINEEPTLREMGRVAKIPLNQEDTQKELLQQKEMKKIDIYLKHMKYDQVKIQQMNLQVNERASAEELPPFFDVICQYGFTLVHGVNPDKSQSPGGGGILSLLSIILDGKIESKFTGPLVPIKDSTPERHATGHGPFYVIMNPDTGTLDASSHVFYLVPESREKILLQNAIRKAQSLDLISEDKSNEAIIKIYTYGELSSFIESRDYVLFRQLLGVPKELMFYANNIDSLPVSLSGNAIEELQSIIDIFNKSIQKPDSSINVSSKQSTPFSFLITVINNLLQDESLINISLADNQYTLEVIPVDMPNWRFIADAITEIDPVKSKIVVYFKNTDPKALLHELFEIYYSMHLNNGKHDPSIHGISLILENLFDPLISKGGTFPDDYKQELDYIAENDFEQIGRIFLLLRNIIADLEDIDIIDATFNNSVSSFLANTREYLIKKTIENNEYGVFADEDIKLAIPLYDLNRNNRGYDKPVVKMYAPELFSNEKHSEELEVARKYLQKELKKLKKELKSQKPSPFFIRLSTSDLLDIDPEVNRLLAQFEELYLQYVSNNATPITDTNILYILDEKTMKYPEYFKKHPELQTFGKIAVNHVSEEFILANQIADAILQAGGINALDSDKNSRIKQALIRLYAITGDRDVDVKELLRNPLIVPPVDRNRFQRLRHIMQSIERLEKRA